MEAMNTESRQRQVEASVKIIRFALASWRSLDLQSNTFNNVARTTSLSLDSPTMEGLFFNTNGGFVEGIVRGYRNSLLTGQNYSNLVQCESIDGSLLPQLPSWLTDGQMSSFSSLQPMVTSSPLCHPIHRPLRLPTRPPTSWWRNSATSKLSRLAR